MMKFSDFDQVLDIEKTYYPYDNGSGYIELEERSIVKGKIGDRLIIAEFPCSTVIVDRCNVEGLVKQ